MDFTHFTPTYVIDEQLRMNRFKAGLNPDLKEPMSIRHYTLCKEMYDTIVNIERAIRESNEFYTIVNTGEFM